MYTYFNPPIHSAVDHPFIHRYIVIHLSICPFHAPIQPPIYSSTYLHIKQSIHPSPCPSTHLPMLLFTHPSIYLFIHLSICWSILPSTSSTSHLPSHPSLWSSSPSSTYPSTPICHSFISRSSMRSPVCPVVQLYTHPLIHLPIHPSIFQSFIGSCFCQPVHSPIHSYIHLRINQAHPFLHRFNMRSVISMCIHKSILSMFLSTHPFICSFVHISMLLCNHPPIHPSHLIHLHIPSILLPVQPFIYSFTRLYIGPSILLTIPPSIYLSIRLFISPHPTNPSTHPSHHLPPTHPLIH